MRERGRGREAAGVGSGVADTEKLTGDSACGARSRSKLKLGNSRTIDAPREQLNSPLWVPRWGLLAGNAADPGLGLGLAPTGRRPL